MRKFSDDYREESLRKAKLKPFCFPSQNASLSCCFIVMGLENHHFQHCKQNKLLAFLILKRSYNFMLLQTHTVSNQGKMEIKNEVCCLFYSFILSVISSLTLNNNQQDLIDTPRRGQTSSLKFPRKRERKVKQ